MPTQPSRSTRLRSVLHRPVTALTTLAMLVQAVAPAIAQTAPNNQTTPDSGASPSNRPQMDKAANGVPIVNIVAPNDAGVSHNKYKDFNVDTNGLILNNSVTLNTSQIGGLVLGNPNLKASGPATLILNEVTSTNRSVLRGYIEVNGSPAAVIVANPNGITCGGCGFINTPRATLTTGIPQLDAANGALRTLAVNGGDIVIEGAGLDATRAERFELVTRAIQLNGVLQARDLLVSGGTQDFDYATGTARARTAAGLPPINFYLDSTALGGMYANRIRLIGTEHGLGIRAPENMAASAGDMEIRADGRITLKNASATGQATVASTSDRIDLGGILYSDTGLALSAPGAIAFADDSVAGTLGDLSIEGGSFTIGKAVIAAGLKSNGTLGAGTGNATLTAASGVTIADGALLHGGNTLRLTAGTLSNLGSIQADHTVTLKLSGSLSSGGAITSTGAATLDAASIFLATSSVVASDSDLRITALGTLTSAGTIRTNHALRLTGDGITLAETIAGTDATLAGGSLIANGALSAGGRADLSFTRSVQVSGTGVIAAVGDLSMTAPSLDNAGAIVANGSVALAGAAGGIAGSLANRASGRIASGKAMTLRAGDIASLGLIRSGAGLDLSAQNLTSSGQLSAAGALRLATDSLINGGVIAGKTGALTVSGAVDNQASATLQAVDGLTLTANAVTNRGQIASAATLGLQLNSLDNNAGHIDAQGDVSISGVTGAAATGDISNTGGEIGSVAGNVALSARSLTNGGLIAAAQNVGLTTALALGNVSGGLISAGKDLRLAAGTTLSGAGQYRAAGTLSASAHDITIADALAGGIDLSGVNFTNAGKVTAAGNASLIFSGTLLNPGGMTLEAGGNLAARSSRIDNGGALRAQGSLLLQGGTSSGLGDLVNRTGGRIAAGTLAALDFSTSANAGTITSDGNVTLLGGTVSNGGEITARDELSLALARLANTGLVSADGISATIADTLDNGSSGVLQAQNRLTILAKSFNNLGLTASGGALNLGVQNLVNDHALLIAKGNVTIAGPAEGTASAVVQNLSGTIESTAGNIAIRAIDLENIGDGIVTNQTSEAHYFFKVGTPPPSWLPYLPDYISRAGYNQLFDGGRTREYAWVPSPDMLAQILRENNITTDQLTPAILDRYVPTSPETFDPTKWEIVVPDEARHAPNGSYVYSRDQVDVVTKANTPGQILTDRGNITIDAGLLHNKQSTISANGNLVLTGGSVLNEGLSLNRYYSLGLSYNHDTVRAMGWDRSGDGTGPTIWWGAGAGAHLSIAQSIGAIPSTITATGSITGNLSGTFANIGTPATDPASFEFAHTSTTIVTVMPGSSTAPTLGNGVGAVGGSGPGASSSTGAISTDAAINQSTLKAFAPAVDSSRFVIETRLPFIDVASFFGSDYFFERLGIRPDDRVKALGDAYFDTTIVREQILLLTGNRFLDPSIASDTQQMKLLIEAGVALSQKLNLAPGVGLTAAQQAELTSSVVLYEEMNFQGKRVLVPHFYPSSALRAAASDKATRVDSITTDIAAAIFVNNDGLVAGRNDLRITASGQLSASGGELRGGNIVLTGGTIVLDRTMQSTGNGESAIGTVIGGATKLRGDTITLTAPKIALTGITAIANKDILINAGSLSITPAEAMARYVATNRDGTSQTSRNLLLLSDIQAGGSININATDTAFIRAATLKAGENVVIHAGELFIGSGEERQASSGKFVKHGFTSTTTQWDSLVVTQIPTVVDAGKSIEISTTIGDTIISASILKADQIAIGSRGQIRLETANNEVHESHSKTGSNLFIQSMAGKGVDSTTAVQTELQAGRVSLTADKGIVIQVRATQDLGQAIDDLAQFPGFAYLAGVKDRGDVHFEAVRDQFKSWDYHQVGLSAPAAAVLAIAVAIATNGMGASLLGFSGSSTAALMSNAGFSALASSASQAVAHHLNDPGAALRELASSATVRAFATAVVTAGILNQIGDIANSTTTPKDFSDKAINYLRKELVQATTGSAITTAINGGSFTETLIDRLKYDIVMSIGGAAAEKIGNAAKVGDISEASRLIAQAAVGCGIGVASGSDCKGGAAGALAAELAGGVFLANVSIDDTDIDKLAARGIDVSKFFGAMAAFVVGSDPAIAGAIGEQVSKNNNFRLISGFLKVGLKALRIARTTEGLSAASLRAAGFAELESFEASAATLASADAAMSERLLAFEEILIGIPKEDLIDGISLARALAARIDERATANGISLNENGSSQGGAKPIIQGGSLSTPASPPPDDDDNRIKNTNKQNSPIWKKLRNYREDIRTDGSRYYKWDYTHNDIEVYNSNGRHLGSMDPTTGKIYKNPNPLNRIKL